MLGKFPSAKLVKEVLLCKYVCENLSVLSSIYVSVCTDLKLASMILILLLSSHCLVLEVLLQN